jgi:signal transduction histidine kinase
MIEQWGGQITLRPAPERGTCVEMLFPLALPDAAATSVH